MKQLNSNFSNAKVGDKVYHVNGSVREIVKITGYHDYPIQDDEACRYDLEGKYFKYDDFASIFTHPVKIIHADNEPFVERVMEVSNDEDFSQKRQRVVFKQKCGYYMAWNMAKTIEQSKNVTITTEWKYAREIQPVNPRIAEIEREIQRLQNELETLKEVSK
jgi:hypothetical protein